MVHVPPVELKADRLFSREHTSPVKVAVRLNFAGGTTRNDQPVAAAELGRVAVAITKLQETIHRSVSACR